MSSNSKSQTTKPPGDGWSLYIPPDGYWPGGGGPGMHLEGGHVLEIWRKEWGNETNFITQKLSTPEMNVYGLYWRVAS